MDLLFFVGANGAGKSFKLNEIFNGSNNSLYVNEEGQPTFSLNKPSVKIDLENKTYYFLNDLNRGRGSEQVESEEINEEFIPVLESTLELQHKNDLIKSTKSKGQEKFTNLLNIFTEFNFNNIEYICLDEPENFLDEDYIKEISRLILELAEAGYKVRIATHSVRILTECNAKIEQISILNRMKEYRTNYEEIREKMRLTRDEVIKYKHKDYTINGNMLAKLNACDNDTYLNVLVAQIIENEDFFKCLFNKTIILVEGASEIIALKTIKGRFGDSTELFSPHGKVYMPFFVSLFNSLGKEVIVIIDSDKEDNKNKLPWILTQYFKNEQERSNLNLITHEPDFEEFYEVPWEEIAQSIGMQAKNLNGELKQIVAMIFFNDSTNQQRLYENIQMDKVRNDNKYTFV